MAQNADDFGDVAVEHDDPAEETTDASAIGEGEDMESQLAKARLELAESQDRYLRAHAEMENYKKRIERTYADNARNAKKHILLKLLSVKDNLERALAYGENAGTGDEESIMQGVRLTEYQLDQLLRSEGVTPMELEGQLFNPEQAEAISTVVDPEAEDHSVAQVVQQGYTYQDLTLRPAQVVVAVQAPDDSR